MSGASSRPRVGLVGARRRRQGLGPFVARDLGRSGAAVTAFVTTNSATRDATAAELATNCDVEARGYLEVDAMLASEALDAVAILSPAETHAAYLAAACGADLHVLCEKPLVWGCNDLAGEVARAVDSFERAGLMLFENCQWPYTLPTYERLFPGALRRPPERFAMAMQPANDGVQAFGDSMPHALSLLQALIPGDGARLDEIHFARAGREPGEQHVGFRYTTNAWSLPVDVHLTATQRSPRAASYALDGNWAHRRVEGPDYRLSFVDDRGRSVPLADPLTQLIDDFVAALCGRSAPRSHEKINERATLLGQLVEAYDNHTPQQRMGAGG